MKDCSVDSLYNYEIILTDDGHITLHSKYFKESCHSTGGAYEETKYYYVDGCSIIKKMCNQNISILEIGFGVGLGYEATILELDKMVTKYRLNFISVECDENLIKWVRYNNKLHSKFFPVFSELKKKDFMGLDIYQAEKNGNLITIIVGDARKSLLDAIRIKLIKEVNAIYQDPFSPTKNPSLWTVEWFELLGSISEKTAILSTYSASSLVRKSLIKAGWGVKEVAGIFNKKSATIAGTNFVTDQLLADRLSRSHKRELFDADLPIISN